MSSKLSTKILNKLETPDFIDKDIDPELLYIDGYDIVMEFVWLSFNYVGAACHAALEYETDFWTDFMNVSHDMYLRPMAEFWGNESILSYYPVIFGGFGISQQHREFAAAITIPSSVLRQTAKT